MGKGERKDAAGDVIRRWVTELERCLGETREQRVQNASRAIDALLLRLPIQERGEALQRVVAASPGWFR
jgi:hypothetical protein